jgi:hypothetical protein
MKKFQVSLPIIAALLGCFLLGCGEKSDLERYYPLTEGLSFTHNMDILTVDHKNGKKELRQKLIRKVLAKKELMGKIVVPILLMYQQNIFQKDIVLLEEIYYVISDKNGIAEFGKELIEIDKKGNQEKNEPEIFDNLKFLLKPPLTKGNKWEISVYNKFINKDLLVNATIESLEETVSVPAGTYKNCLKIRRHKTVEVPSLGQVKAEQLIWYAPKVGMVKSEKTAALTRPGSTDNELMVIKEELESFN